MVILLFLATLYSEEYISIISVGDIMLSRGLIPFLEKYGSEYPFKRTKSLLKKGDVVIGNFEGFISTNSSMTGKFIFRASTSVINGLVNAGFNVLTLANNHILDGGYEGLSSTLKILKRGGILFTGAGMNLKEAITPAVIKIGKKKVAVISCTTVVPKSYYATEKKYGVVPADLIVDEIKKLRVFYDHVIVSIHWGKELCEYPTKKQIKYAHSFIDAGAEMVVGHHPHVIQGIEVYKGRIIAYSLGNFIFDNPSLPTSESFILCLKLLPRKKIVEVYPIFRRKGVPRILMKGEIGERIIEKIIRLSNEFGTKIIKDSHALKVVIPTSNEYIQVDKSRMVLEYLKDGKILYSFPVALGMKGCTPEGRFIILNKIMNPGYREKDGKLINGGDSKNPLGKCWLGLDRWNLRTKRQYGIHGTNDESRIGKEVSRGCIELLNQDVIILYKKVKVGTEVFIFK